MTDAPDERQRSPRGRRTGKSATRDQILHHAVDQFAELGYAGASVRGIAAAAGVDPSLVAHFYGTKEALFEATTRLLSDMPERVRATIAAGRPGLGGRLTDLYFGLWEDPSTGPLMQGLFRSVTTSRAAASFVQNALETRVLQTAASDLPPRTAARLPLAMNQLVGVALARYVLKVPSIAAMPRQELVESLTPAIEATLG